MISTGLCTKNSYYLVLNAVEDRIQVVIGTEQNVCYVQEMRVFNRAMGLLPGAIEHGLQITGLEAEDLYGIACVRGPGNFTGIRIVLSIAAGMSKGSDLLLAGMDYLPILAESACWWTQAEVWVLTHARHGLVYMQGFSGPARLNPVSDRAASRHLTGPACYWICDPSALSIQEAIEILRARREHLVLLGSGVSKNMDYCKSGLPQAEIWSPTWDRPGVGGLLSAAIRAQYSRRPIDPLYLRKSDAEENIGKIATERGIDLQEATRFIQS